MGRRQHGIAVKVVAVPLRIAESLPAWQRVPSDDESTAARRSYLTRNKGAVQNNGQERNLILRAHDRDEVEPTQQAQPLAGS